MYIVTQNLGRPVNKKLFIETYYVESLPGWTRCDDGSMVRDGSFKGGPGWSNKKQNALIFKSHRAAKRIANKCPGSVIRKLENYI